MQQDFAKANDIENEEEFVDIEDNVRIESTVKKHGARKKLEELLEEKRLRAEIDDFLEY